MLDILMIYKEFNYTIESVIFPFILFG